MSHFYTTITNKGTTHNKCGNKDGMIIHARGWNIGVEIELYHNEEIGKDVIQIAETKGSNNPTRKLIRTIVEE